MKSFRALLLGLLCFAISIQGFAHVTMAEKPCPMQRADGVATIAMADDPDCCNDADTFARTGKLCKTGQECSAGGIGLITSLPATSISPVVTVRLVSPARAMFDPAPAGVWRPPSSI